MNVCSVNKHTAYAPADKPPLMSLSLLLLLLMLLLLLLMLLLLLSICCHVSHPPQLTPQ